MLKRWFLLSGLMMALAVQASESWEGRIVEVLQRLDRTERERLAYVQRIVSNDRVEEAQYRPMSAEPWQLLSVDGMAATEREQETFADGRRKEQARRDGETLADLITPGSIVEEERGSDGMVRLSFVPQVENMDGEDALRGTLLWSETEAALQAMHIVNDQSFSPRFSVRIEDMMMSFQFQTFQGLTVPKRYEFAVSGKLAGLKRIDVASSIEYLELQLVSEPTPE